MCERLSRSPPIHHVLLYLPLAQDIAGKECLLALSLMLCSLFTWYARQCQIGIPENPPSKTSIALISLLFPTRNATIYLIVRNTSFRPLSTLLSAIVVPLLIPALLLLSLNLYSSDRPTLPKNNILEPLWSILRLTPSWWEKLLGASSPIFTVMEGIATLLCIQAVSRFSLRRIAASRTPDVLQLFILVLAALVYVIAAYFLWHSYASVVDRFNATLIGVEITSILFLSGIGFALQKGTVIETSLVMAYAVFQIFHLANRPAMYSGGLLRDVLQTPGSNGHPPLPPVVLKSLDRISTLATQTFGAGVEFIIAASSALPLPVLVGLFYRVTVLYAASRIILALKRKNEGYEDTRKLSEEDPFPRFMTIVVTYSRLVLIAVYTHLLISSSSTSAQHHATLWRWTNVFLTTGLWALELMIGKAEDMAQGRFKSD
ncbi:BZ3500_MvSof-1268-A1-R1_Chr2-2g04988 [Microbotryum saponariae]|uniref:BZ3500_MvSof-1268-A1-R1_Chr2-2g04988 protein n=1 Tax=Microbotryum saponariae TaxID=289078 RepID=A0A2X0N761_9BASI|nr:BZ3500_MvSof-1268-A1-R1_Chr2-2g04988 [Microbotryum saponariae]SDA00647.1 BZ3501_MvSof-1269-A2-R1_Chr2-2g04662 [Microbotryum saponariae]